MDDNTAAAAEKYEELHTRLIGFFEWQGCHTPEDCADDTIDRAARKIEAGATVPNVQRFVSGIARYVLKEYWKFRNQEVSLELAAGLTRGETEASDDIFVTCIERCLRNLSSAGRSMLLEYVSSGNRAELAGKHGLTLNALRIRICKLTKTLEKCALPCVAGYAKGVMVS